MFTFLFLALPLILVKHFHTEPDKRRPETVPEVDCEETVSTVRLISWLCVAAVKLVEMFLAEITCFYCIFAF